MMKKYILPLIFLVLSFSGQNAFADLLLYSKYKDTCQDINLKSQNLDVLIYRQVLKMPKVAIIPTNELKKSLAQTKKKTFICMLLPHIHEANAKISEEKIKLHSILSEKTLSIEDRDFLNNLEIRYRVPKKLSHPEKLLELIRKVDTIPPSIILAQAVIESGWGTSRFLRDCNNMFGRWGQNQNKTCQSTGSRKVSLMHFDNIGEAIEQQILYLNSHSFYKDFRDLRKNQPKPRAMDLLIGLIKYSEERMQYVDKLASVMSYNNLDQFDIGLEDDKLALQSRTVKP